MSYKRLAGGKLKQFGDEIGFNEELMTDPVEEIIDYPEKNNPSYSPGETTPSTKPNPSKGQYSRGSLSPYLSVDQNNPVDIKGDGNQIDNSINQNTYDMSDNRRYYGGSSRTFNYEGGKGLDSLYDTPVSMATMGGFYDPDDSPAAAASFLDRYVDMNIRNQNDARANYDSYKNTDYSKSTASGMDYEKLYGNIQKTIDTAYRRSDDKIKNLFGDKNALIGINPDAPGYQEPVEEAVEEPEKKEEKK